MNVLLFHIDKTREEQDEKYSGKCKDFHCLDGDFDDECEEIEFSELDFDNEICGYDTESQTKKHVKNN